VRALEQIDGWGAPNAAAAVVRSDGVVAAHGPREHDFRWASVTKLVTALAVLVAAEEGTIDLEEAAGPPGSTLRHLLAHASGLPFEGDVPIAQPGRRRIYSNTGFERLADAVAERALRGADGVRTVTAYSSGLVRRVGVEPADEFPAYMDFAAFQAEPVRPLPERPQALFVGVLERYKNVDGLAEAWRAAAPRVPAASLRIVGNGTLRPVVEQLVHDLPEQASWSPWLPQAQIAHALDESTLLVLPSRSEGMGRVIVEAFCRGRPVVGSRVGGIPDLVEEGVNGLLVDPDDRAALVDALVRLLADGGLAERLAASARTSAAHWTVSADDFARRLRALVERVAR
jgi:glycosyltransferase involved in cell wall biosynthesis